MLSGQNFADVPVQELAELPAIQTHAVFSPGTPQEYIDSIDDSPIGFTSSGSEGVSSPSSIVGRWTTTATNGSGLKQGDPTTLTWSIVPNGTPIPALGGIAGESAASSDVVEFLGEIYGVTTDDTDYTDEPWFTHLESVFNRWSELTGITYVYEANDDGTQFVSNNASYPGVLGVRGDVRIGGHSIDGDSNVLGYNFFPNHGEMVIDTSDNYFSNTTNSSRGLRNTVAHEAAHGIGIEHVASNNARFLMEAILSTSFDGPQLDDILAAQQYYGDTFEPNDTAVTATDLGLLAEGQTLTIGGDATDTVVAAVDTSFLSIDNASDSDMFSFTLAAAGNIDIMLMPLGPTYNQAGAGGQPVGIRHFGTKQSVSGTAGHQRYHSSCVSRRESGQSERINPFMAASTRHLLRIRVRFCHCRADVPTGRFRDRSGHRQYCRHDSWHRDGACQRRVYGHADGSDGGRNGPDLFGKRHQRAGQRFHGAQRFGHHIRGKHKCHDHSAGNRRLHDRRHGSRDAYADGCCQQRAGRHGRCGQRCCFHRHSG
ncbi:MAG TPA: matrixin family metalloprotease [Fuerstia sp.]|nr:matrixin family metalloprotease [Fuerstiella sp.]